MSDADPYAVLVAPLNATGIPYMVTGAHAASMYGEMRFTEDLDVVMQVNRGDAKRLHAVFRAPAYYIAPLEAIEAEAARDVHGHFNIMHNETSLRMDVHVAGREASAKDEFERRTSRIIRGETVWFTSPETLIVSKLRYVRAGGGDHHVRDIAGMLRVSGDQMDHVLLERTIHASRLDSEWERVPKPAR